MSSIRYTKGCDHAQSEHLQRADFFVGHTIWRGVSVMLQLYADFRNWSCPVLKNEGPL